ncbi:hypothetical protein L484_009349 [Morus notabilis]|uniref:Uncharacterized protein n=1 Tax=Morus notabilis TaxID=981085 RepID=W9R5Y4_9ROSA|nr:hypothetical protein L484_009349 [Morus notabilis]
MESEWDLVKLDENWGFLILWTPFVDLKLGLYIFLENMLKSDPKFAGFGFVPRESAIVGPGIFSHRLTGPVDRSPFHRSIDPVDRSLLHRLTGGVTLLCHRSTGFH